VNGRQKTEQIVQCTTKRTQHIDISNDGL